VGHSIGGMTILSFCRLSGELLGREISGLVLIDTTYTKPLKTMIASPLMRALEKPVLVPLLYLTMVLWPLVWLWSLSSYLAGTAHLVTRLTSFSRGVTRGQLDFGTWFTVKQRPSIVAKGLRAVLRWDESDVLREIRIPARVVVGDADRMTLPSASRAMADSMPMAELIVVRPAGHTGILEEGSAYGEAIAGLSMVDIGSLNRAAE
jgi:pimeloyl-ACP methyl ester carboxylesterase